MRDRSDLWPQFRALNGTVQALEPGVESRGWGRLKREGGWLVNHRSKAQMGPQQNRQS